MAVNKTGKGKTVAAGNWESEGIGYRAAAITFPRAAIDCRWRSAARRTLTSERRGVMCWVGGGKMGAERGDR